MYVTQLSLSKLTCRQLSRKQFCSRYTYRFASSLPDWNSTPDDAVPASLPFDLLEQQSQAPSDFDVVAHTTSPALDGPAGAAISLIDNLHSVTGLPWWATLSVTALGKADASTAKHQGHVHWLYCREQHVKLTSICRCPCSFVPAGCASDTSKCRCSTSTETGMVQQQTCLHLSYANGSLCMLAHSPVLLMCESQLTAAACHLVKLQMLVVSSFNEHHTATHASVKFWHRWPMHNEYIWHASKHANESVHACTSHCYCFRFNKAVRPMKSPDNSSSSTCFGGCPDC